MARDLCMKCQRPTKACICSFICKIDNKISVLVLQHPSEVNQTKGTVALLQRSLKNCQIIVGENFSDNNELNNVLTKHQALLLYPSEKAQDITLFSSDLRQENLQLKQNKPLLLIILDGTWRKSYRMFMLSKNLQTLPQVCLPEHLANKGQYLIRKVAKKNALSSLEATCYALTVLESKLTKNELAKKEQVLGNEHYQPLLNKFEKFNLFQLSFRE